MQRGALDHVSRETLDMIDGYVSLLVKWNSTINLVSRATLPDVWTRHVTDCSQLLDIAPASGRHWVDLGTGGGLPGIVVAILSSELAPHRRITLVESDKRKIAFLNVVKTQLNLKVTIAEGRIELLPPLRGDIVSARALAPLKILLGYVSRHITPGGMALLPKGREFNTELAAARTGWRFSCEPVTSKTQAGAVILRMGNIVHA